MRSYKEMKQEVDCLPRHACPVDLLFGLTQTAIEVTKPDRGHTQCHAMPCHMPCRACDDTHSIMRSS